MHTGDTLWFQSLMSLPLIKGTSVSHTTNTAITSPSFWQLRTHTLVSTVNCLLFVLASLDHLTYSFEITIKNNNSTHSDVLAQAGLCLPVLNMHGANANQYMLTHQATAV